MQENWPRVYASARRWEGGDAVRVNEPGGAVSRGISLTAYREEHPEASIQDLFAAPDSEIERIYRKNYADKVDFDYLPAGLDAVALHGAIMFGVNGIKKMMVDGDWAKTVVLMMQNKMNRSDGVRFMPGCAGILARFWSNHDRK